MSNEVGVDVERIGQLASALENLRDVLAANVPTIVNTMNKYWSQGIGSPISLQPLHQAQSRSVDDATDIRDRATMAVAFQNRADVCLAPGSKVDIPWDSSQAQLNADSAKAAAQNLAAAEAESATNPKAARAQIQAIQAEVKDNLDSGDTSWLGSFYNAASPQVANLAATLNREDGQTMVLVDSGNPVSGEPAVLTKQDQQILNTFASGLAAADKTGKLNQTAISDYASKAKNLWSVGMLFKFGPPGSAYGTQGSASQPNLLAQVTTAIEMARLKPTGYTIPLNGPNASASAVGADYTTKSLAEFDPAQAMLTLATQNGAAATQVLAGPHGAAIAASLMKTPTTLYEPLFSSNGKLQGFFPEVPPVQAQYLHGQATDYTAPLYATAHPVTISSSVIGNFFNTATNVPRGTGTAAKDAAYAAMHIIDSTPPPSTAELAAPVQAALLATAQRYELDLGTSSGFTDLKKSHVVRLNDGGKDMPWTINIAHDAKQNSDPLADFLQQITSNTADGGALLASTQSLFSYDYGLMKSDKLPPQLKGTDPSLQLAQLMGQIRTQSNNVGIERGESTDARNAQYNALLSFAESEVTKIPVIGAPLGGAQTAAGLLGVNLPTFSTDNAATAYTQGQQSFADAQLAIKVPMAQGLLNEGVISPSTIPSGQTWYRNGKIILANSQDVSDFDAWYSGHPTVVMENDVTRYQNAMSLQQSSSLNAPTS